MLLHHASRLRLIVCRASCRCQMAERLLNVSRVVELTLDRSYLLQPRRSEPRVTLRTRHPLVMLYHLHITTDATCSL